MGTKVNEKGARLRAQATSHRSQVASYRFQVARHMSQVTCHTSQAAGQGQCGREAGGGKNPPGRKRSQDLRYSLRLVIFMPIYSFRRSISLSPVTMSSALPETAHSKILLSGSSFNTRIF
jgi:hypothetical protein